MSQATKIQNGTIIDYTPVAPVAAGQVVVQGSLVGVATAPLAAGQIGALETKGVFDIVKITGSITAGAPLYWKAAGDPVGGTAGTGGISTTSSDGQFVGYAVAAALSGDATVRVRMYGVSTTNYSPISAPITDPGNAGAIPVTGNGCVDIVTAGAETRTLAAPTFSGQMLSIGMKTDGGDCVITCSTGIDQTPHTTITLNDIGDHVLLVASAVGGAFKWRLISNNGATIG